MEKAWPPLKECYQHKLGMLDEALCRYPWEDDGYAFDFDSYYPPIPDGLSCIRKLLDSLKKNDSCPSSSEDTRNCPFCPLRPGALAPIRLVEDVDILNHPVWDMDPIPCPDHLMHHIWSFGDDFPAIITPQQLENTKKYLNQVRNSRGYDVDCFPHPNLVPQTFYKKSKSVFSDTIKGELESTVMDHIELKTKKKYILEKILKIVSTNNMYVNLVTFTAKVMNDDSAAPETFIATLYTHPDDDNPIMECLLKPDGNAPGPDHYPVYESLPFSIPCQMRQYMRSCDPRLEVRDYGAQVATRKFSFFEKPICPTPGKDTSSAAAPTSSVPCPSSGSKRFLEAGPISDSNRDSRRSQCKVAKGRKASSRAAPMVDAKEYLMRFLGKKQPSASTAEEMLTRASDTFSKFGFFPADLATLLSEYQKLNVRLFEERTKNIQLFNGQAKLKEEVEKWKSQACSLSMDKEAHLKAVRTCRESYLKSQAGVTPKDLSPLDPSICPLQHVEAEPLQTLPTAVEENRDEGSGSSVHVKETSPNPVAEAIPSTLI